MKSLIILIFLTVLVCGSDIKNLEDLIKRIHIVETGGKTGKILGDNRLALGPLQIHYSYWKDATDFDKTIKGKYQDCSDYDYSVKVVRAYFKRYGVRFLINKDWESLARIHNGGPLGYKKKETEKYWKKIKEGFW